MLRLRHRHRLRIQGSGSVPGPNCPMVLCRDPVVRICMLGLGLGLGCEVLFKDPFVVPWKSGRVKTLPDGGQPRVGQCRARLRLGLCWGLQLVYVYVAVDRHSSSVDTATYLWVGVRVRSRVLRNEPPNGMAHKVFCTSSPWSIILHASICCE